MSSITFDLHRLGWKSFEDLVGSILSSVLGQSYQVFSDGVDAGRDGAFSGVWVSVSGESFQGKFVVQCKHTADPTKTLPDSVIRSECKKISKLVKEGSCDTYLLVTNHSISAIAAGKIEAKFIAAGAKSAAVYGASWINSKICENARLRRLVPRLYGLGDLTQIITHQAYLQAKGVLEGLMQDLQCFVPTDAYRKSARALVDHGFVMLVGEPASGKTMIANLLALSAADEWDLQTIMFSSPEDLDKLWNPSDPKQFFWVDDAFGATQYDIRRTLEWNQRLLKLKTAIRAGGRVVFTSRDYIFKAAKDDLKISSFELFDDSRVTIHVEDLSQIERQMILYNHLKFGSQSKSFLASAVPYLEGASAIPRFLPEVARRFASPKFTSGIVMSKSGVVNFFDKPMKVLEDVIVNMGKAEKSALALIFIHAGKLPSPLPDKPNIANTIKMIGSDLGSVKLAFTALDGSFVTRVLDDGIAFWKFRHPTIGDAFATVVSLNPELVQVYLAGVTTDRLMGEVTCGDVELEGVKIVMLAEQYKDVINRLRSYKKAEDAYYFSDPVTRFLSSRCSKSFLKEWFNNVSDMDDIAKNINHIQYYNDSIKLVRKLIAFGLLPEVSRNLVVQRIEELSVARCSVDFMNERVVGEILTDKEKLEIFNRVAKETISSVDTLIDEIESDWDGASDPEDGFSSISNTLRSIVENGSDMDSIVASKSLAIITSTIEYMNDKRVSPEDYDSLEAENASTANDANHGRSIFDDLVS